MQLLLLLVVVVAPRLSASEALSAGLVSRVVPAEQLLPEALKIGDKLARWGWDVQLSALCTCWPLAH